MEFRVLGPVRATAAGTEASLGGARQRRLLAVLLLGDGRVVGLDRIIEAVWGEEEPPAGASRTVLSYVSRLRTALGEGYVSTRDEGYLLDRNGAMVDADQFAAMVREATDASPARALLLLDEALSLWGGRAFGDLADEDWCRPGATRLEELRLVALEARGQARLDVGSHAEAVPELEQLVVEHPLRDRFRAQLMLALFRSGRQAEALRSFQRHRHVLADETGLDPSRELVELERRIALADPTLQFVTAGRTKRGYVLADVIGEGAFGTVYRAVQPSVGREVAVKVVRAELADDPDYVRRFEGEARLVARLEHPHIVPLYDFWREPGAAYLVFRYVRGGNAEAAGAAERRWPLARVGRLVEEIGAALAAAHDAGVIHRDVKPANVLFDEAGNAYLADFGIATDAVEPSVLPSLRSAGSPLYASPEQVRDGTATPRSDQYALAVMSWELLAGAPPFEGDRVTTILRTKLECTVPSLGDRRPDVPAEIDTVLHRAAAVHPDDRYASMAEFLLAWREAATRPVAVAVTTGSLAPSDGAPATSTLASVALAVANPYKGLRAFDEADARDFHGREAVVDRLVALVHERRFVVVVGPSGSGKSSLVRAGLVPRLRAERRLVAMAVPGARPVEEIAEALVQVAVEQPVGLTECLLDAGSLAGAIARLLPDDAGELVLVLDQFEELWTLADPAVRDRLLDALVAASAAADSRLRIVATVRADFYDRPLSHPSIGALVEGGSFSLAPLGPAEMERAMSAPAARLGVRLEPALAAELVADVSAQPAGLPLLQYALTELFDHRDGGTMTMAAYEAIGGLAGALTSRAEAIHEGLGDTDRAAVRRLFARLVAPGEGTEDTRRRARRSELAGVPATVIDAYGAARLLTFDVDPFDREPTVEVAHEALIRHWPRLRAWLDEDRDGLRVQRHLTDTAAGWDGRGRDAAELYRGARLAAANEWAERHDDELAPTERAFVHESRRRARRSRRLAEAAVGALGVLVIAALVAAGLAVVQRRRADRNAVDAAANAAQARQKADEAASSAQDAKTAQESSDLRRLAFQAQTVAPQQPQLGLLLAVEAQRRAPGVDSDGALLATLDNLRLVNRYVSLGERATAPGDVSGDHRLMAVQDGVEVILLDGTTLAPTGVRVPLAENGTVRLSPDGRELATGTAGGLVRRWDTATGKETAPPITVAPGRDVGFGVALAYLRRGRLVAADGVTLRVYEPGAAAPDQRIQIPATSLGGLRNSDSGRYLAVTADFALTTTSRGYIYDDVDASLRVLPEGAGADGIDEVHRRLIGSTSQVATYALADLDTLQVIATHHSGSTESAYHWTMLPDGSWVGQTIARVGFIRFDADLKPLPMLVGAALAQPQVSADGRIVTSIGNGIGVIDTTGLGPLATTLPFSGQAAVSGDGTKLAIASDDGVRVLDPGSGAVVAGPFSYAPGQAPFAQPALSTDGRLVAYLTSAPSRLRVVDVATGAVLVDREVATYPVAVPAFAPDDDRIALPTFAGVDVLDGRTGQVLSTLRAPSGLPFLVRWDPSGRLLASSRGSGEPSVVSDAGSGATLYTVPDPSRLEWSPDGARLAVTHLSGDLALLDADSGRVLRSYPGLVVLGSVAFTPDANRLLKASIDFTLQVIDLASGTVVGRSIALSRGAGNVPLPAFSPDRKTVYIGNTGTPVVAYDMDPASWPTKACVAAGRNLTRDEWRQYLGGLGDYRATCPQYAAT